MPCETHQKLNNLWSDAALDFSNSVAALSHSNVATMSRRDYFDLVGKVETARLHVENVRDAVHMHQDEHGC